MACPPGYYCWEGTETADWNSEGSFKYPSFRKGIFEILRLPRRISPISVYQVLVAVVRLLQLTSF